MRGSKEFVRLQILEVKQNKTRKVKIMLLFIASTVIASRSKKLFKCGLIGTCVHVFIVCLIAVLVGSDVGIVMCNALIISLFSIWLPVGIVAIYRKVKSLRTNERTS